MELEVRFDTDDPPSGSVRRAGADTAEPDGAADPGVPFVGWLGLLAALDELTQPAD